MSWRTRSADFLVLAPPEEEGLAGQAPATPPIVADQSFVRAKGGATSITPANTGGAITSAAVTVGTLPDGLTLNNDGSITGTPTTVETQTVTIEFTNDDGTDAADITIDIVLSGEIGGPGTPRHGRALGHDKWGAPRVGRS